LSVAAVALGVGVVVAIELAGRAAAGSFSSSLATLTGATDLEISANGGIDELWMGKLATLPWNVHFIPVLEREITLDGAGVVTLYGVDPFSQPPGSQNVRPREGLDPDRAAFVSSALANRLALREGAPLGLLNRMFTVAGIMAATDAEFIALDIAAAQQALGAYGKLDRIDVYVGPGEQFERVEAELRRRLPAGYLLSRPGARGEEKQRMLRAFRWNLRILSYISLIVGAFLIYNTIAVSVVRRRAEIGVLRAIGTSRAQIALMFLGEALALGAAGSATGLLVGRVLAEGAVGLIANTVSSLYTSSRPAAIHLDRATALLGLTAGILVSLLSALAPSREAMSVHPVEAMQRGAHEYHARLRWRLSLVWAAIAASAAVTASLRRPIDGTPVFGYVAALLAIAAMALATPAAVIAINALARPAAERLFGVAGALASRSLEGSLGRTAVIIGALATAIAVMASIGIMVGSFRETVRVWLEQQLRADIYVRAAGRTGPGQFPPLRPAVIERAQSTPGIVAVDVYHGLEFRFRGERAQLGTHDLHIRRRFGSPRFLEGALGPVVVSEPFARKHNLHAGESIALPLGSRAVPVTISGVYYDYSSSQGWVLMDRSLLLKHLPEQPATNLAIYVEGGRPATVERELRQRLGGLGVVIARNDALRRNALEIFDRTFAVTYALEAVAIVVAMLGAANSLLALVLDRRREIAVLRYLGAAARQLRRMILLEAVFCGLLANLLGMALGFGLSLLLIFVINKQSFGWTIQFHPPAALLAGAAILIWCATVLAALYPARIAIRLDPVESIHEE
jgi:putative ABC transport system permease protein